MRFYIERPVSLLPLDEEAQQQPCVFVGDGGVGGGGGLGLGGLGWAGIRGIVVFVRRWWVDDGHGGHRRQAGFYVLVLLRWHSCGGILAVALLAVELIIVFLMELSRWNDYLLL